MKTFRLAVALILSVLGMGCTQSTPGPSPAGRSFLLASDPGQASGVVSLKVALAGEQPPSGELVIVGRVGGGPSETFDPEEASFLLRDMDLKIESHDHGGNHDNCKFCQAEKAKELESMALVRIVDERGNVIPQDAQRLLGLRENHIVVAQGTGSVDEVGTFVFDATKIYIRP